MEIGRTRKIFTSFLLLKRLAKSNNATNIDQAYLFITKYANTKWTRYMRTSLAVEDIKLLYI